MIHKLFSPRAALIAALAATLSGTLLAALPTDARNGLLVAANGMTLYTSDNDGLNQSRCRAWCRAARPIFSPAPDSRLSGELGVITRADGDRQVTFRGKPLYFYAADLKPGDVNGDEAGGGVWHMVRLRVGFDAQDMAKRAHVTPSPEAL